jgi:hypothetical protein
VLHEKIRDGPVLLLLSRFRKERLLDPQTFDAIDPSLDKIAELADKQLASEELRRLIVEIGNLVGERRIASVNLVVDQDRPVNIVAPRWAINASSFWTLINAHVHHVEKKLRSPQVHRGSRIREVAVDFSLFCDADSLFPSWCNEGKVTVAKPKCDKCGFEVDPRKVVWG